MNPLLEEKYAALESALHALGNVVVAYSGGVDSTFLAAVAHEVLGSRTVAVTARSPAVPARDLEDAVAVASAKGWNHEIVDTNELSDERYVRNDGNRCYWCKTELLEVLNDIARRRDACVVLGTNVDDLGDRRPGIAAATRKGARAPLVEAGLTKSEIRELSRRRGLPTAEKPASPCLSSRVAYGVEVTPARLERIERAERALRDLGFDVLRVRDHGELARIEVPADEVERAARMGAEISAALRDAGFAYVTLDLLGFRSGSLNEVLPGPHIKR